jgi:hypothetical protein
MKKLIYLGFALLMGATIVSCSNDDEYETDTEAAGLSNDLSFPSDGGKDYTLYHVMNLDTVNYAKIYYDSLPRIDTTGIGIDAHIELIGDTTICDWAKMVWDHSLDPKYVTTGKISVEVEPNTTGRARFMRVGIALKNEDYIEEIVISQEANK